ncbi:MAG: hypothetical protein M1831_002675 [Alyxoria varia]|nr:MAG: hypothetical protein M1831_002675 [Alyxoria varia]
MPGTVSSPPSISLSFANNFWGKDDAGVTPLLERMHGAKVTSDELKAFYSARATIEEEYARKLLGLARKPLGSCEEGTLRISLDVIRGELESVGKAHQNVAAQMKMELDEQLAAFAGGMKERRKIVQTGIEKLLKVKTQQSATVNKARDRYEQDCLKIKGYLAQGHMVMGQEERKNKAKLEKTQIQLSTTSNEYEAAVKVLEETTGRWNRDWKGACDKFQDLEEERVDFMKSSLWSFANIASTVCVSDDASCEKIRLSLEDCDVEKDISTFIKDHGTGQEIPDPPKFINFCRDEITDNASEASNDEHYSVAQFQRTINPAFRSSSPKPSSLTSQTGTAEESDPRSLGNEIGNADRQVSSNRSLHCAHHTQSGLPAGGFPQDKGMAPGNQQISQIPHNEYPMDGMTQFCRVGPPSEISSAASPNRPSSRESQSELSNPTSYSSQEPSAAPQFAGNDKDGKNESGISQNGTEAQKKKSGFFQSRSPFRRKSKSEKDRQRPLSPAANRKSWAAPGTGLSGDRDGSHERQSDGRITHAASASPEPVDPRASYQLNVGGNVFDVASPEDEIRRIGAVQPVGEELDPMAQALANLKGGVSKESSVRMSADRYHGIATPASQTATSGALSSSGQAKPSHVHDRVRPNQETRPPPSYNQQQQQKQQQQQPMNRLGAPQPAFTSRQMQQTTQKFADQNRNMFNTGPDVAGKATSWKASQIDSGSRTNSGEHLDHSHRLLQGGGAGGRNSSGGRGIAGQQSPGSSQARSRYSSGNPPRATSPNPYHDGNRGLNGQTGRAQSSSPVKPRYDRIGPSPDISRMPNNSEVPRAVSPQPQFGRSQTDRPRSRGTDMPLQLAPTSEGNQVSPPGCGSNGPKAGQRPVSQFGGPGGMGPVAQSRGRSKSMVAGQQYTRDGRSILHFCKSPDPQLGLRPGPTSLQSNYTQNTVLLTIGT